MKKRPVKKLVLLVLVSGLLISLLTGCDKNTDPSSVSFKDAISNGRPTLAEFGRGVCRPCKAMKPILEELSGEYKGELNVVIVEVDANMDITSQYEIMMIPTQIFFDSGCSLKDKYFLKIDCEMGERFMIGDFSAEKILLRQLVFLRAEFVWIAPFQQNDF